MGLQEFLHWLYSPDGGALVIVMWAVSWFLEPLPAWQRLESRYRALIIVAAAVVLGVLATWMQNSPAVVSAIEPYFHGAYNIVILWLGSQVAHRANTLRQHQ